MPLKLPFAFLYADLATYKKYPDGASPWRFSRTGELFGFRLNNPRQPVHGVKTLTLDNEDLVSVLDQNAREFEYDKMMAFIDEFERKMIAGGESLDPLIALTQKKVINKNPNAYFHGAEVYRKYFTFIWERGNNTQRIEELLREVGAMPYQLAEGKGLEWPPPDLVSLY